MQEQHPDRLLNTSEAGQMLGLQPATIRRMVWAGELPVIRPTGKRAVRFRHSDLEALLRMRSQPMRGGGDKAVVRAGV